ncbi:MAG: hypothetical protein AB8G18_03650 [Gammaproteobacteria bacterium]
MRIINCLVGVLLCTLLSPGSHAALFINEFHYDNAGMDVNEGIELAGTAGTDLSGYHLLLYNGSNGSVYSDILLEGVITDQSNSFGAIFFETSLQNGPDGIALTNSDGEVLQFISYEGSFTATEGSALGMTSIDVGVFEANNTKPGASLQLAGSGTGNFDWILDVASSGQLNSQQSFGAPVPVPATLPLLISALTVVRLARKNSALTA